MNKRLLSMFLALCMIVTMLPVSAMAEEIHTTIGGSGEIISFAPLSETEKTVSLGTSSENLELPETLAATVRTAVPAAENPTQDSGSPETATPTTAAEPEWEETTVNIPVTWDSPFYDPNTEGVYVFTPVIEGYTVSAPLPELTVTVDETLPIAAARGMASPLSATTYNIWVGGVQVTDTNKDDVLDAANYEGATITYDPDTSTLTLDNATINAAHNETWIDGSTTAYYGIYADTALKIEMVGSNTVLGQNQTGSASIGIYTGGTLNLSGSGSLYVSGGTGKFSAGIYSAGSITIEGGRVTAASAVATQTSIAIASNGDITISNEGVEASASTDAPISYGMIATNGFTINDGEVTAVGKTGLHTNAAEGPVTVSEGVVNAVGTQVGISGAVAVTSGTVTVKSDAKALDGTLTTSDYANCTVTASTNKNGGSAVAYNAANLATYKYIKVESASTPPVLTEVADRTALQSAITGAIGDLDLKLSDSYIDTAGKLTIPGTCNYNITIDLNGRTLAGGSVSAIEYLGSGTLTITDSQSGGMVTSNAMGTIYAKGTGTVNLSGGTVRTAGSTESVAIWVGGNKTLNITGGTVIGIGFANYAIYSQNGTVNISGGTVSATGVNGKAICGETGSAGQLNISGGTVSATWTGGIAIDHVNATIQNGTTIIIQGSSRAMTSAPTLDSGVQGGASTNYDGSGSVAYNAANIATYKYLKFGLDVISPVLSAGNVNRTNDTAGTIGFTTDKAGTAYYLVVNSGASAPTSMAVKAGTSLGSVSGIVTGKDVTLTAGAKDIYVVVEDSAGNISTTLKIPAAAYVAPPVLSAGNVQRASDTAATIGFTTDKAGTAYYLVVNSGASAPTSMAVKAGTSLGSVSGAVAGKAVTLTAGAKDIYVVVEDSANNISTPLKIPAAAYVPPVLSAGSVNRTSDTAATIGFTTDKAGTAYYLVVNSGASAPTNAEVAWGGGFLGFVSGTVTGKAVTLTVGAKDIYVVVFDLAGNISAPLKIEAAAYAKETPTKSDLVYSLTAVDYDGTAKPVSVTAAYGKNLGTITVLYDSGSGISTSAPINAGTYTVKVNIAGSAEYNAATGLELGNYTINKVVYTGTTTVLASVLVSGQTGATVTLPALPIGASYGSPTSGGAITMTNMSVAGNTLTYTAPASTAGQTGTMTIPVTGATNYNDYSIVVTVTYTAKIPQAISYANATVAKTYGDAKFVNTLTQTAVNGAITYESDDTSVATVNATTGEVTIVSVGDGSATITATAAETSSHAQATASYTVTVSKKALTLKAEDTSMTKGDALPTFTYTATGLVNGDTVTTAPTMSTTADGTAIGTFDITISGGVVANAASYTITYTKGILTVTAVPDYTVTFNPNGGTVSETSRSVASGTAVGTLPTPTRSGSYSFDGWYTAASGGTQISVGTTVSANVTYYAHWTYTGGGGSGGGGGSSSNDNSSLVIVTPPAPDKPNSPTQGEIKVPGIVDGKGNVTVSLTDKTVTDAFNKALAEAKKNDTEQNGITVVLRVDTGNKTGSNVTVNLPKAVQDTIIAKKIVNTIVVVDNPDIRVGMDLATVQEINKQAKSDVNITATRGDSSKLTGDAKKAIGSRPVFDLKVNYGNGKEVSSFGAGSISVTIPYTLGANEKAGNVQAVYVDAKGKVHWLTNSVYDSVEKVLRFSTDHFSTYGIGYKQTNTAFTDIAGHWAKGDIELVVSRGLFSGTSETKFSPNTTMTRGMFVTALGRLANADVSGYTKSSFTDVKGDAYYMGYIEWASKNNIVNGTGNNKFAPDQSITREQMAVIMSNYAKTIGYTLPKVHIENIFTDNAKISTYAKEAVKQMQMAGVISGKSGNLFDPQSTATRAEVSAVLRRFVELAISSDTAQGWSMNDSGKWMYFKDGKPLTGKQDIDGVTYTFDQYGVTADVPKNLRYTTYTVQKGDSFWSISRKLGCPMSELERLNNKSRFSLILPGDVLRVPEK